jgi:hypothetical protein
MDRRRDEAELLDEEALSDLAVALAFFTTNLELGIAERPAHAGEEHRALLADAAAWRIAQKGCAIRVYSSRSTSSAPSVVPSGNGLPMSRPMPKSACDVGQEARVDGGSSGSGVCHSRR